MRKRLSEEIEIFLEELPLVGGRGITLGRFFDFIPHRGFGIVLLLLSLPAAFPTPTIGHATLLGPLIILLGLQILAGKSSFWLPNRICQKQIPPGLIVFLRQKGIPFLKKIEKRLAQRMEFVTQRAFRLPVGLTIVVMGAIMMIPIPLTNTLPALVVFIISLGLMSNDGLFVLAGLVGGVISLAAYLVIAALAMGAFR